MRKVIFLSLYSFFALSVPAQDAAGDNNVKITRSSGQFRFVKGLRQPRAGTRGDEQAVYLQ